VELPLDEEAVPPVPAVVKRSSVAPTPHAAIATAASAAPPRARARRCIVKLVMLRSVM
jgi:hypothetical protein